MSFLVKRIDHYAYPNPVGIRAPELAIWNLILQHTETPPGDEWENFDWFRTSTALDEFGFPEQQLHLVDREFGDTVTDTLENSYPIFEVRGCESLGEILSDRGLTVEPFTAPSFYLRMPQGNRVMFVEADESITVSGKTSCGLHLSGYHYLVGEGEFVREYSTWRMILGNGKPRTHYQVDESFLTDNAPVLGQLKLRQESIQVVSRATSMFWGHDSVTHIALEVEGIDELRQELTTARIETINPQREIPNRKRFFAKFPSSHRFEFFEDL